MKIYCIIVGKCLEWAMMAYILKCQNNANVILSVRKWLLIIGRGS